MNKHILLVFACLLSFFSTYAQDSQSRPDAFAINSWDSIGGIKESMIGDSIKQKQSSSKPRFWRKPTNDTSIPIPNAYSGINKNLDLKRDAMRKIKMRPIDLLDREYALRGIGKKDSSQLFFFKPEPAH